MNGWSYSNALLHADEASQFTSVACMPQSLRSPRDARTQRSISRPYLNTTMFRRPWTETHKILTFYSRSSAILLRRIWVEVRSRQLSRQKTKCISARVLSAVQALSATFSCLASYYGNPTQLLLSRIRALSTCCLMVCRPVEIATLVECPQAHVLSSRM